MYNYTYIVIGGALRLRLSGKLLLNVHSPDGHVGNAEAGLIGYNINVGPVHYLCRGKSCLPYFNLA